MIKRVLTSRLSLEFRQFNSQKTLSYLNLKVILLVVLGNISIGEDTM